MAEYTAIIEAANAFVDLLRKEMTPEPISKPDVISLCSPHEPEDNQLTVYLFHVEDDPENQGHGYFDVTPQVQRREPTVLKLYFLITAHSKAPAKLREADQLRIVGRVIQIIGDHPTIGGEAVGDATFKLALMKPSHEQLLKIWNSTSNQYKLSLVCEMAGVSIDSKITRKVSRVSDVAVDIVQKRQ